MDIFSNIDFGRFLASLQYMWQGMLCIFIVIGVIMLSVYAMGAVSTKSAEKKRAKEEAEKNANADQ